jgi:hypothetical protein
MAIAPAGQRAHVTEQQVTQIPADRLDLAARGIHDHVRQRRRRAREDRTDTRQVNPALHQVAMRTRKLTSPRHEARWSTHSHQDRHWSDRIVQSTEHAACYGLRHEVVCREVTGEDGERVPESLSEHIEARGMWPDAARRYCTSDLKRAPVYRLMTRLAREQHAAGVTGRIRILNVLGLRAQESPHRAAISG